MKKITYKTLEEMLWKNGKGTTRQIAIYPEDATLDNFNFRISSATVNNTGPFSEYPNINRSLAVLEGEGLILNHKDDFIKFTPKDTIIDFYGMDKTIVNRCPNTILDFGVMSRKGYFSHSIKKITLQKETTYYSDKKHSLIFSLSDNTIIKANGKTIDLNLYDSLLFDCQERVVFNSSQNTDVFIVTFINDKL